MKEPKNWACVQYFKRNQTKSPTDDYLLSYIYIYIEIFIDNPDGRASSKNKILKSMSNI